MIQFLQAINQRIAPFYDPTAWILIVICAGGVALFDPVMAKTILQWVLIFGVFAGVAVIISRHTLPQISLTDHVKQALAGNVGAGMVVLGICVFMAFLVLALTIWGKA